MSRANRSQYWCDDNTGHICDKKSHFLILVSKCCKIEKKSRFWSNLNYWFLILSMNMWAVEKQRKIIYYFLLQNKTNNCFSCSLSNFQNWKETLENLLNQRCLTEHKLDLHWYTYPLKLFYLFYGIHFIDLHWSENINGKAKKQKKMVYLINERLKEFYLWSLFDIFYHNKSKKLEIRIILIFDV